MSDEERFPGRRDPDDTVIPVVMLMVEEKLKDMRHSFRQELAGVAATVAAAQAQSSKEHEAVRTDIANLRHSLEELRPLRDTVAVLERQDIRDAAHDDTVAQMRKTIWLAAGLLVAVVGAVNGLVAVLVP